MKISEQKLEQAKNLLCETQIYFDTISEFISSKYIESNIIDIADKILKSMKNKLEKYSRIPLDKKTAHRKILKSLRIKYLYLKALLMCLQRLYNEDYPADKHTDFAILSLNKFYNAIN